MTESEILELLEGDVLLAAPALIGAEIVRGSMRARIVETEAYRAEGDPACHAYRGCTPRNRVLFGPPGRSYVYFNYGMHWMLNVSAHADGFAAGILIRAAEPLTALDLMRERRGVRKETDLLSGPGKLAKAFGITSEDNDKPLFGVPSSLRIFPRKEVASILTGPRIGIAVGKAHEYPWRFLDADRLKWASRPLPPKGPVGSATLGPEIE